MKMVFSFTMDGEKKSNKLWETPSRYRQETQEFKATFGYPV